MLLFFLFFSLKIFLSHLSFQALDMVKKTPAYKNKLKALELERTGGVTSRKKSNRQTNKYENFLLSLLFSNLFFYNEYIFYSK